LTGFSGQIESSVRIASHNLIIGYSCSYQKRRIHHAEDADVWALLTVSFSHAEACNDGPRVSPDTTLFPANSSRRPWQIMRSAKSFRLWHCDRAFSLQMER
jgi:hypothetical protein